MSNYDAKINMDRCVAGAAGIRYCSRIKEAHKKIATLEQQLRVTDGAYKTTTKMCDEARQQRNDMEEQLAEYKQMMYDRGRAHSRTAKERDTLKARVEKLEAIVLTTRGAE